MSTDNQVKLQDSGGKMKRYAIVEVNKDCNKCELGYKKYSNGKTSCRLQWFKGFSCENYGDTKEQLISKVEQIIRRPIQKGDLELKSKGFKYGVRRLAKEIVEFLGVE